MIVVKKQPYQMKNTAVCIGKFDGLHMGHQSLIAEISKYTQYQKVLFTFAFPEGPYILTPEEKYVKAEKLGIDFYVECPFDETLKELSAEEFFDEILLRQCDAKVICVGDDFHFGKNRGGDVRLLQKMSEKAGIVCIVVPKKKMYDEIISSTRIRKCLGDGSLSLANELLGAPYMVMGEVVHGNKIGRTLDMPTANQIPEGRKLLPPFGVYASRVCVEGEYYFGVTNLGVKPTIPGENQIGVETCLLQFEGDLYGKKIQVELCEFIRGERKFANLEQLMHQMEADKKNAGLFFGQPIK